MATTHTIQAPHAGLPTAGQVPMSQMDSRYAGTAIRAPRGFLSDRQDACRDGVCPPRAPALYAAKTRDFAAPRGFLPA